ncbi:hypothetical protein BC628DRAFT_1519164 [Trametes gibbosa]|nr:hypothetical protein BC628DRAFT_1519164 [Trametes gibbosa]
MSSSNRLSPSHRRRSHSASSPIPRRQPDDVKWHISAKRSRPISIRSPSYKDLVHDQPAEKWDVDQWRRGKRARRDSNSDDSADEQFGTGSDSPTLSVEPTTMFTFASGSTTCLPNTSAAFQFFPQKKARRLQPCRGRFPREPSPREAGPISPDEASRMRADALGELHRSVAENGEGLVRKMRDWESTRSRSARLERLAAEPHQPKRTWRRLTSHYGTPPTTAEMVAEHSEEEEDIFIVGEASSFPTRGSPARKKRALSAGTMDVNILQAGVDEHPSPFAFASLSSGDRGPSPATRSSGPSAYSSEDEGHVDMDVELESSVSGPFSTPALSHTYSTSTNSSVVSLPLSAHPREYHSGVPVSLAPTTFPSTECASPTLGVSPPTTRSEKAIAALALAMANGAVGISDYDALRAAEGLTTLDASHAGELWS